jgi:hypothetical protein
VAKQAQQSFPEQGVDFRTCFPRHFTGTSTDIRILIGILWSSYLAFHRSSW